MTAYDPKWTFIVFYITQTPDLYQQHPVASLLGFFIGEKSEASHDELLFLAKVVSRRKHLSYCVCLLYLFFLHGNTFMVEVRLNEDQILWLQCFLDRIRG